jgi:hypothetical protein
MALTARKPRNAHANIERDDFRFITPTLTQFEPIFDKQSHCQAMAYLLSGGELFVALTYLNLGSDPSGSDIF